MPDDAIGGGLAFQALAMYQQDLAMVSGGQLVDTLPYFGKAVTLAMQQERTLAWWCQRIAIAE